MNSDDIIDACLRAIGESDVDNPQNMTRATCLIHLNHAYQDIVGPLLNIQTLSTSLTVSSGSATLPTDFLSPIRVYDGDPSDGGQLLQQINDINQAVNDDDATYQYRIADETTIKFHGTDPSGTIYFYYKAKPSALTDSSSSSPFKLKSKFHYSAFTTYVKMVYAKEQDYLQDYYDHESEWLDILQDIESAHTVGRYDFESVQKRDVWSE